MSQNLLLSSLTAYYNKHPVHRKLLHDIVQGVSPLSLRVIDWFVTHYARINNVIYWINDATGEIHFEYPERGGTQTRKFPMYLEYRAQLKSYTKLFFDPFRRHERISFVLETSPMTIIETTVGQLNFFRWTMQHHVLEYVMAYLPQIEEDMAKFQKAVKVPPAATESVPCKRRDVLPNTVVHGPCHLRFD